MRGSRRSHHVQIRADLGGFQRQVEGISQAHQELLRDGTEVISASGHVQSGAWVFVYHPPPSRVVRLFGRRRVPRRRFVATTELRASGRAVYTLQAPLTTLVPATREWSNWLRLAPECAPGQQFECALCAR